MRDVRDLGLGGDEPRVAFAVFSPVSDGAAAALSNDSRFHVTEFALFASEFVDLSMSGDDRARLS